MNFFKYIGASPEHFEQEYINLGFVTRVKHDQFPLDLYCYSRKTVQEDLWDRVTSRCRGIIVNRETGEIVSRPYEKFHNYGSSQANLRMPSDLFDSQPVIWEKVDGFMCTLYRWEGKPYIASKGSFNSIHAKWATAEYLKHADMWPVGWTPVFEGLHPDLRIVVDYKDRCELVLTGLINNETGEEVSPGLLRGWAQLNKFKTPERHDMTWERALEETHKTYNDGLGTDEGYVFTWYRKGQPPIRLKAKFDEYCRLHRIVTGVSARRVWEVLSTEDSATLEEWLERSTPWFAKFARKWVKIFTTEYKRMETLAHQTYDDIKTDVSRQYVDRIVDGDEINFAVARRANGEMLSRFKKQNEQIAPILYSLIDKDDIRPVIWKIVRQKAVGVNPLVDAHNT